MKCPRCNVDLQTQTDHGVPVEGCPKCSGLWLTPLELDQLEDVSFDKETTKGSLYVVSHDTNFKCPVCTSALKRFNYRFYELEIDCCPEHGFWLNAGDDARIIELMQQEEDNLIRKFKSEDAWSRSLSHLRAPSFFTKLKDLFRR